MLHHDVFVVSADLQEGSMDYDYSINGMKFFSGITGEQTYQRALAKVLRDQMDDNTVPNSNSLAGWWIRGQSDWSGGAGREYQEPPSDDYALRQFDSSAGVDPFNEPGFLSLIPKPIEVGSFDGSNSVFTCSGFGFSYVASGERLVQVSTDGLTEITGITGTVSSLVMAGSVLIVWTNTGGFVVSPGETTASERWTTSLGPITGGWVKQRLILFQGNRVYEETIPVSLTNFDTLKPIYTHPDADYRWVGVASAPAAILLAGYGISGSEIFSLTLDESGNLPTSGVPVSIAEFPANEQVTDIATYLGTFVAIATTKGVRIGESVQTQIRYGPLIGSPVSTGKFSSWDRFVVYPVTDAGDGRGGLVKIDLSVIDDDGRAAWANFLRAGDNPARGQVVLGDLDCIIADSDGSKCTVFHAHPGNGCESGWIQGSWIRYGTLERKNFVDITVVTEPDPKGSIEVLFSDDTGSSSLIGTMEEGLQEATFPVALPYTMTDGAVRLMIHPDGDGAGPKINSWSVRALPTPKNRSELIQLVLLNFDFERDAHGATIGFEGRALQRWKALLGLLRDGATVTVEEITQGDSYLAMCQELTFTQVSNPAPGSGFGGLVVVQLRVVG